MSSINIRRATLDAAALLSTLSETVREMHTKTRPDIFKPPADVADLTAFYSKTLAGVDNFVFIGFSNSCNTND